MRVLTISTRFNGGGAERTARETCMGLIPRGVEPTMFTCNRRQADPTWVSAVRTDWEKYLRAIIPTNCVADWRHIGSRRALDAVASSAFDLVHIHSTNGGWMSISALARLTTRIPSVWTLHDEWAVTPGLPYDLGRVLTEAEIDNLPGANFCDPNGAYGKSQGQFLRRSIPRPAAIITPSRYLKEMAEVAEWFSGIPVTQIPNGLPMADNPVTNCNRAEARRAMGLPKTGHVLLLVAAHTSNIFKGIGRAVEAIGRLNGTGVHLLVVGQCGEPLPIALPVTYTGFLEDDDAMARAYRAADVTLIPSIADNFPYVALESLVCSTPLVAFEVGGLCEMVGDNLRGLLTRRFDTAQFARNIQTLLDDEPLRVRLGQNGRQWVRETCDPRSALSATLQVYEQARNAMSTAPGIATSIATR